MKNREEQVGDSGSKIAEEIEKYRKLKSDSFLKEKEEIAK